MALEARFTRDTNFDLALQRMQFGANLDYKSLYEPMLSAYLAGAPGSVPCAGVGRTPGSLRANDAGCSVHAEGVWRPSPTNHDAHVARPARLPSDWQSRWRSGRITTNSAGLYATLQRDISWASNKSILQAMARWISTLYRHPQEVVPGRISDTAVISTLCPSTIRSTIRS